MPSFLLRRIVSGGQTGVDRAALDIAIALGIGCGGWVPRGRRAEDGTIASHYPVRECRSSSYGVRTRLNVRDTDGTLILCRGRPSGGTSLTLAIARELARPVRVVDLDHPDEPASVRTWIANQRVKVLNVAGPRESGNPGIHADATAFLRSVLCPDKDT
ncbi:MAG: molybdenum cofactor carrier [Rhodospirillales bacterium]|nr:molybdenum cofactor carrier [Rhodospirillales bacterium]